MVAPVGEQSFDDAFNSIAYQNMCPGLPEDRQAVCAAAVADALKAISANMPEPIRMIDLDTEPAPLPALQIEQPAEQTPSAPYDGIIATYRRDPSPRNYRKQPAPTASDFLAALAFIGNSLNRSK